VTTDFRRDRFSDRSVQVETCSGPQPTKGVLMFETCSEEAGA
jgi:hypothetical protein